MATGYGRQPVSTDDVARMSAEDIFSFRQQYGNRLRQLLQAGAESASCALHQELLRLVSLWVRPSLDARLPVRHTYTQSLPEDTTESCSCFDWALSKPPACLLLLGAFIGGQLCKDVQNEAEEFLWEHCPRTVHRFAAFAQRLDDQQGVSAALKWRNIAVRALFYCSTSAAIG